MAKPDKPANENLLLVGVVGAPRGLKGEVRVKSFTDRSDDIGSFGELTDEAGNASYVLKVTGKHKESVIVRIKGIDDRTAAENIRGLKLFVRREQMPKPSEDEFYLNDLVGLNAVLEDGKNWGRVVLADDYGAGPILEVELEDGKKVMVPFSLEVVPKVDLENGLIVVCPPDGLDEPPGPEEGEEKKETKV